MTPSDSSAYRDRLVDRLRALLDSRGYSVSAVEKELDHHRGYVAEALRGVKKLTVETILEVLAAVGVPPEEFFERPMPPASVRRRQRGPLTGTVPVATETASASAFEDESPVVRAMLLLLAKRGLLATKDLDEVRRELAAVEASPPPSDGDRAGEGEKPGGPTAAR